MTNLFDWFPREQRVDVCASVAALVAAGDTVACVVTRKTRAGCGADVFVHSEPAGDRKTERGASRKNLADATASSLAFFVVALARPQLGKSLTQIEASGIDIMLVLDVSGSMLTKDFTIGGQEATRVDAIREVTRKFIEARPNDRIGIIAFAGRPYVVSPMTLDHDWLLQNLDRVKIGLVEDGTAIGSAMACGC